MGEFYRSMTKKKKISLNRSLTASIKQFLNEYQWNLNFFRSEQEIIDNLYVYWFLQLMNKNYSWNEGLKEELFESEFVYEMKKRMEKKYKKIITSRSLKEAR